jgi:hypothetical protein
MLNFLLLAKSSALNVPTSAADKGLSMEWGIVLIGLIIGLAITLSPPKRTYEIKKQKEE